MKDAGLNRAANYLEDMFKEHERTLAELQKEHAELKEKHEKLRTQAQEFYDSSVAGWKAVRKYTDAIDELYAIRKS